MIRSEMLNRVKTREKVWDFIIIGGGATGVGCAVDAASRGFDVLLLEQSDFGKGTSSRSTKLIHGGVRYLAQANLSLVKEALKERATLKENAPHLVKNQSFIVPCYSLWQKFFYGTGLKTYNFLSGKYGFGKSRNLSKKETLRRLPNVKSENLRGGVLYYDGQFDDARLLIDLTKTAVDRGATVLSYAEVYELTKPSDKDKVSRVGSPSVSAGLSIKPALTLGLPTDTSAPIKSSFVEGLKRENKIDGVKFRDAETGEEFTAKAKVVINATGAFCDAVREMSDAKAERIIAPSQGIHLVFDEKFLSPENALMIPKTSDGRVLFAIPWHGKIVFGTTDTPIENAELEPKAFDKEIEFILQTAKEYLDEPPQREDILSVFVGVRPLVKRAKTKNTAALSRGHTIEIDGAGLLTITGGKWTTYRRMAEDAINQAAAKANLPTRSCVTKDLKIHGFCQDAEKFGDLATYGTDAEKIQELIKENPNLGGKLYADLPYCAAEIIWAIRFEMARTLEDVLARRTRALFLNARAAIEIAPRVAEIMANELGKDRIWIDGQIEKFNETAKNYFFDLSS